MLIDCISYFEFSSYTINKLIGLVIILSFVIISLKLIITGKHYNTKEKHKTFVRVFGVITLAFTLPILLVVLYGFSQTCWIPSSS